MIDCVTVATSQNFRDNLLVAQHRLRYQEVIAKEKWGNVYATQDMEFDRYDNLATEYFIARDQNGDTVGVCRSYPTTIPYMLAEVFQSLCTTELPSSPHCFPSAPIRQNGLIE
jgi:N-acyl-L-homoserine lactone synthetase